MRREFNRALLPKEPPPKHKNYSKNINGSPFNTWFRDALKKLSLTIPEFARISRYPQPTIRRWRKTGEPRKENQKRLAKILAGQGLGSYDKIHATIMRLCDDERAVR